MARKWIYDKVEFKVGDYVKVVRFAEDGQKDGMGFGKDWDNTWIGQDAGGLNMDGAISSGYEFEIIDIMIQGAEFADFVGCETQPASAGYYYPLSSLEKVKGGV